MKEIKEFLCDKTPTDEEIIESIKIVNENDCVVNLKWFVRYNGWHNRHIRPGDTFDEVKESLPKVYGV